LFLFIKYILFSLISVAFPFTKSRENELDVYLMQESASEVKTFPTFVAIVFLFYYIHLSPYNMREDAS